MEKKRLVWADTLKGWLILLVILGHAIQRTLDTACETNHLWNLIYSFHMPAFMAVSGYLAYRPMRDVRGQIWPLIYRRFRQLVIPFILWTTVWLSINGRFSLGDFGNAMLYPDGGLWFLWVLFVINVIFLLGDALAANLRIKQEIVIGVICLLLAIVMVYFEIRVFGYQFISYYFILYAVGYFLHKHQDKILTNNNLVIIGLAIVWCVMAWFWQMQKVPYFLQAIPIPQTLLLYVYRFVTAIVAIYVLFAVSPRILNSVKGWNKSFIEFGRLSLGIYTVHFIMIKWVVEFFKGITHNEMFVITCSFIVTTFFSYVVVWLLSKWRITENLLLGKV